MLLERVQEGMRKQRLTALTLNEEVGEFTWNKRGFEPSLLTLRSDLITWPIEFACPEIMALVVRMIVILTWKLG